MQDKKVDIDKLKELEKKNLPENVRKSVEQKIKQADKPVKKWYSAKS